jgi:ATP-dependent Clp protease ATP-binding subunit ClpC
MAELTFHYQSSRARASRQSKFFSRPILLMLLVSTILLVIAGATLIVLGLSIGWIVIGVAGPLLTVYIYARLHLTTLPAGPTLTIDDTLDASILALLPPQPTPADIGTAVAQTPGGQFFAARFGTGATFLSQLASKDAAVTSSVWQTAQDIQQKMNLREISSAAVVAALIHTHDDMKQVLNHLQLTETDILNGVEWYEHIQKLIAHHKKPKHTGGIARDLAFGYTPLLKRFGINISEQISANGLLGADLETHYEARNQMIQTFSSRGHQNVTLIGPTGVGKTELVHAFAEKILDAKSSISKELKFRQVVMLDPASLIGAAPGRGQLENLINEVLNEAYRAKNIIICLDDAHLFFEEGIGAVDISNILVPILEGGGLRIILTMDEQRYQQILQRKPNLANALNRIILPEPSEQDTIRVLQDKLIMTEFSHKVTYMYQALKEAYRLSQRYVHELAQPGRAFKLLESAASYNDKGLVTAKSVQDAIEKTMNVKVGVATGESEKSKLLNLEDEIHKRMINQTRAVNVISDALRRARAGVRNENRPIGTFLFLGPTGVGKTELAKALAEVYFGGENNITRIDLNEYVKLEDVERLIADGVDDPNSLTAQVMRQPFSVVLLDEIEKAHPNVLTALLQVLDEGILRDIKNREVSFRDAIVIATSNAGADRIRQYIEAGHQLEQFEDQIVNELIDSHAFKPEFLNRFDEIVVFRPLTKDELLQVIDLILAGINRNMAIQKITVTVDDDAKRLLVDKGYDPRLGARPMRRVVQRSVENLIAKKMLSGEAQPGSTIHVTIQDIEMSETKEPISSISKP